ncbi:palmitoyl-protein thioesterase ABHD10, mitochondrial isoform X2 [Sphaerodactylus townsendi]|uniref:palmitoyl-protein thioesterase ABHD10, mitochondrial isoform X2 n=1 Tax=Sphaerodactylus townsendi TaxID=933632 RepID=UPI002026DB22|nr:palmitoyl-protein thioesterase ABHD10, mitochondrial isoform X2 [Sphaerodactylus townsendi]
MPRPLCTDMAVAGVVRLLRWGKFSCGAAADFPYLLGCRQKSTASFLSRPDRPKLAYNKLKGKNPGVVFLPGLYSTMNGKKALALEDFCKSLGHAFVRFDYTGCGSSEGDVKESTMGKWRKDVLSILVGSSLGAWLMLHAAIARPEKMAALVGIAASADHLVATFQQLPIEEKKEIEEKGEWKLPTKYNEEGFYNVPYEFLQEAENHCVLGAPLPIKCPVRLLHGLKDEDIPWQTSLKIAERVISTDVDIILRKAGQHRMKEQDDIKLIVYTVEDLIDKLTTLA